MPEFVKNNFLCRERGYRESALIANSGSRVIRKFTYDVVAFNSIIYDEFDGSAQTGTYPA
jgi:hypothetical protein